MSFNADLRHCSTVHAYTVEYNFIYFIFQMKYKGISNCIAVLERNENMLNSVSALCLRLEN